MKYDCINFLIIIVFVMLLIFISFRYSTCCRVFVVMFFFSVYSGLFVFFLFLLCVFIVFLCSV